MTIEEKFLKKEGRDSVFLDDIESESYVHYHPAYVEMLIEYVENMRVTLTMRGIS